MVLAESLRKSILQAAFEGKLTKQLSTDTSVKVLCEKIYKEKNIDFFDKILFENTLYEIPMSWRWLKFSDIIIKDIGGGTPSKTVKEYWGGNIPWMSVKDFSNAKNGIVIDTIDHITQKGVENSSTNVIDTEAIILCTRMGLGKYAKLLNPTAINQDLRAIWISKNISEKYFMYFYSSLKIKGAGTTVKGIKKDELMNYLIPIPPIEEQYRIVEKLDLLMKEIDEYEVMEKQLEEIKKKFLNDMKMAVLQYAMQGKLTKQLQTDSSVDELIKNIRDEKEVLIELKQIKKEKLIAPIKENDKLFDIPDNWKWIRLGTSINLISGQDLTSNKYSNKNIGIPYITGASNFCNEKLFINRYTNSPTTIAYKNNLLLTCKGTIGALAFLNVEKAHIARQIMAIDSPINLKYIKYFLVYSINLLKSKAKSMIPGIDRRTVLNLMFPLPPIEEQQRIVEKLEQILPLLDELN